MNMSNKAIFLDRDGTLIEDPGYLNHPEQVTLLEGVAEALIELRAMGYMIIVTTNQSAVARGIVSEKVLGEIHNRLRQLLTERGAYLDQIYYCPYHPDGVISTLASPGKSAIAAVTLRLVYEPAAKLY
jgi:histidinol-phosphate phosphatase family protein